jgi:hypothetical protein
MAKERPPLTDRVIRWLKNTPAVVIAILAGTAIGFVAQSTESRPRAQVQGRAPTVAEKYDYLYRKSELEEIARQAGALNGKAERVHLAMNNNRGDYPAINGIALKEMLSEDWRPPDREALIEELEERRAKARCPLQAYVRRTRYHRPAPCADALGSPPAGCSPRCRGEHHCGRQQATIARCGHCATPRSRG